MTILCLDCATGISGDMTVAALLDLGADRQKLETVLASLAEKNFEIKISHVKKASLLMTDFDVVLAVDNHDHDMKYLHGEHEPEHSHEHPHDHHHVHRSLLDVALLINETCATDNAKALAIKIFEILAKAEAKAHGHPIHKVHFHEVGAVDSIVDILSVAVCLDDLGVTQTVLRTLNEGYGTVRCQHGVLPIPVPAVSHICSEYGLPMRFCDVEGELITPTGAAILAALDVRTDLSGHYRIKKTGMGAGKRAYSRPSFVRAMLIESIEDDSTSDEVVKLETNIDDCTSEILGYTMERLFAAGALDVSYTPIMMKKNRPAYQLTVLCKEADRQALERIIFSETTSIGIRRVVMQRSVLKRRFEEFETELGTIKVKVCSLEDNGRCLDFHYPEYESVKALAQAHGLSLKQVYQLLRMPIHHD